MRRLSIFTALLALVLATPAAAQSRLAVRPESKLWIEGTSNVHDWKCEAIGYELVTDVDPAFARKETAQPKALKTSVRVPIARISCGKDKMDENLRKALKADANSQILWSLDRFEASASKVTAHGTMTLAGTTRPVQVDVTTARQADGSIKATGSTTVRMTDFGLKPVSIMMGAIKTGDAVTVKFDLLLAPAAMVAER